MVSLAVFSTRWSDDEQKWGEPRLCSQANSELNLPYAYFVARDIEIARNMVKTLSPLIAVTKKGYFPDWLCLGSIWINWGLD